MSHLKATMGVLTIVYTCEVLSDVSKSPFLAFKPCGKNFFHQGVEAVYILDVIFPALAHLF